MGGRDIGVVDLDDLTVTTIGGVGRQPRHLVLSPDGTILYASLNGEGSLAKIDLQSEEVVGKVRTGSGPRSMAISADGTALYVVNYHSNTVSKVRTSDMTELEEHPTRIHPIGVTYDAATREVWVSSFRATIHVFADRDPLRRGERNPPDGIL